MENIYGKKALKIIWDMKRWKPKGLQRAKDGDEQMIYMEHQTHSASWELLCWKPLIWVPWSLDPLIPWSLYFRFPTFSCSVIGLIKTILASDWMFTDIWFARYGIRIKIKLICLLKISISTIQEIPAQLKIKSDEKIK